MMRLLVSFLFLLICILNCKSKTFFDAPNVDVRTLFCEKGAKYVINYNHIFIDTLNLPKDCVIDFRGGKLEGPIVMNNTMLTGKINLKGSSIKGKVQNKQFDASWLCVMDGETDDALRINEMIEVCGNVFFPQGVYRLVSAYDPTGKVENKYFRSIKTHIGICKSNVTLEGEKGTRFTTTDSLSTICLFSMPNQIGRSISNIKINNISFNVYNDGKHFHEFRHTIKVIGVNGLVIENCTFNDFWGDAICLSHYGDNPKTGERTRNQNVRILNNFISGGRHHNNRNGISIINGKNVLIKNNIIKNTSRKNMPGGIDLEPNNRAYTMENIRIEDNFFEGVRGSGGAITMYISKNAPARHIEIIGNEIISCSRGINVTIKTENTTNSIIIMNNHIHSNTKPYRFKGEGKSKDWVVAGNVFDGLCIQDIPGKIQVENLIMRNNKKKTE